MKKSKKSGSFKANELIKLPRPPFKNLWTIGDAVTLASGGPRMLVVDFGRDYSDVIVAWQDGHEVHEMEINKMMLTEYPIGN
jgi:uncharacterized protein YodC (DUF2158 family)